MKIKTVQHIIKKEAFLENYESDLRCLVYGHTHLPEVELITSELGIEKYSINSGTWRSQIPVNMEFNNFGRLRSLTKVLIFDPDETNPEYEGAKGWSFDFNTELGYGPDLGFTKIKA